MYSPAVISGNLGTSSSARQLLRTVTGVAESGSTNMAMENRSLIPAAFAETLRHTSAVLMVMRQASEDRDFHNKTVRAGETVTVLLAAANHDPREYQNPEEFNIFREGFNPAIELEKYASHSTFARGRHFCIGSKLAGLEAEIAANQLLDAMDDIAFADGIAPKQEGNFVPAPRSFYVMFRPT